MAKKIIIELDPIEAAAFDMLRVDSDLADPGARYTDATFAKSLVLSVIEDDLAVQRGEMHRAH